MQISGLQLQPGSVIQNLVIESGESFPLAPAAGRLFQLSILFEGNDPGLYEFNGTSWVTGDISAVNAGVGLLGGGTSGAVTLSVDTSVIATKQYVIQELVERGGNVGTGGAGSYYGAADLLLLSNSVPFQSVSTTQEYCSVRLPDATTINSLGLCFTLHNVGQYAFAIRDFVGTLKAVLRKNQIATVYCSDKSSSTGKWHIGNTTYAGTALGEYILGAPTNVLHVVNTAAKYTAVVPLTATSGLAVYQDVSLFLRASVLRPVRAVVEAASAYSITSTISTAVAAVHISPTSVVCVYQSSASTSGPYYLKAVALSISGSVVTAGPPASIGTNTGSIYGINPAVTYLSANKALCTYTGADGAQMAVVIDVSGLALSVGVPVNVTTSVTAWGAISALGASRAICTYRGNNGGHLNASVLTIAGSAITVGPQTVISRVPVLNTSVVSMSPTKSICIYSGDESPALPEPPVNLRTVSNFAVFSNTSIANVGISNIGGNVGVSPGATVSGFESSSVVGTIHVNDATAAMARADLGSAYTDATGLVATKTASADFIGLVLEPGVYSIPAASGLTGVCTLDGKGDPNAFFVFKIGGAWAQAASTSFVLVNSANARNVYWQVTGAISLGAGAGFVGTALANGAVTAGAGSTIQGRLLGLSTVSLDSSTVSAAIAPRKPALQAVILDVSTDTPMAGEITTLASVDIGSLAATKLDSYKVACSFTGTGLPADVNTRAQLAVIELNSQGVSPMIRTELNSALLCNGSGIARLTDTALLCTYTGVSSNLLSNIVETLG